MTVSCTGLQLRTAAPAKASEVQAGALPAPRCRAHYRQTTRLNRERDIRKLSARATPDT